MRVSTTTIESYRLWADGDWMPESELLATIRGEFEPTPEMLLGRAFGRVLEKPDKYRTDDGYYSVPIKIADQWTFYTFPSYVVNPCLDQFDGNRRGFFEVKTVKDYDGVDVVAKVDYLFGSVITENKAKSSAFDFDKYAESYQWRFYIDIFSADVVKYNVFQISDDGQQLKDIVGFNLYAYPELHNDCRAMLARFLKYVKDRGLEGYLQEKVFAG